MIFTEDKNINLSEEESKEMLNIINSMGTYSITELLTDLSERQERFLIAYAMDKIFREMYCNDNDLEH